MNKKFMNKKILILLLMFSFLNAEDISKMLNEFQNINNYVSRINIKQLENKVYNSTKKLKRISSNKIKQSLNNYFNKLIVNYNNTSILLDINKQNIVKKEKKVNKPISKKEQKLKYKEKVLITPLIFFNNKLYVNYKVINIISNKTIIDKNIWIRKNEKLKNCIFLKIINNNEFIFKCNNKIRKLYIAPEIKKKVK